MGEAVIGARMVGTVSVYGGRYSVTWTGGGTLINPFCLLLSYLRSSEEREGNRHERGRLVKPFYCTRVEKWYGAASTHCSFVRLVVSTKPLRTGSVNVYNGKTSRDAESARDRESSMSAFTELAGGINAVTGAEVVDERDTSTVFAADWVDTGFTLNSNGCTTDFAGITTGGFGSSTAGFDGTFGDTSTGFGGWNTNGFALTSTFAVSGVVILVWVIGAVNVNGTATGGFTVAFSGVGTLGSLVSSTFFSGTFIGGNENGAGALSFAAGALNTNGVLKSNLGGAAGAVSLLFESDCFVCCISAFPTTFVFFSSSISTSSSCLRLSSPSSFFSLRGRLCGLHGVPTSCPFGVAIAAALALSRAGVRILSKRFADRVCVAVFTILFTCVRGVFGWSSF